MASAQLSMSSRVVPTPLRLRMVCRMSATSAAVTLARATSLGFRISIMRRRSRASDNNTGHIIPVLVLDPMVRLPLTPAEVERGQRLGVVLRRARGGRSMLETALDAGVSPETLRKIESGRVATPAFSTVAAVAAVLGLSLDAVWAAIEQRDDGAEPNDSARRPGQRLAS